MKQQRENPTAILLMHCPDREGIIALASRFIKEHGGNVVNLDQHVDREEGIFFMRIEWEIANFTIKRDHLREVMRRLFATKYGVSFDLYFSDEIPRMAIFVSKMSHCLYDLLARYTAGEWEVEIPLIISNHPDMESAAKRFDIPYYHIPITKETKAEQEAKTLELLREHKVDFVVLARYMQIISSDFIEHFPNNIINIHHSFLPAFVGAKPYHAAHARGVKLIGATSHYVTTDLDAGPIIEQNITRISHRDSVSSLVHKGQDLEKIVLSQAVEQHINRKILTYGNKTVLFS
ncbi:MAG: formyltetrahydrofolate deformylase [Rikenellaceae bacterium]